MNAIVICAKCAHYENEDDVAIWHHQFCLAPPQNKPKMNYTTGVLDKPEKIYCRDRNPDGKCELFESDNRKWWF